ncbi:MAG: hypothetical protein JWO63_1151 [Frankiales bacterium]|nr:hypothetical protein [Frankiales bacterium]
MSVHISKPAAGAGRSPESRRLRLPDGSRSVQSPFVWRGFLFMSLIGLGLSITLFSAGNALFGAAWALITIGWFTTAMWLWKKHLRDDEAAAKGPAPTSRSR